MRITEVVYKKDKKNFRKTARLIYKDDNTWVCPLDNEIEAIFDPKKIPSISMEKQQGGYCTILTKC